MLLTEPKLINQYVLLYKHENIHQPNWRQDARVATEIDRAHGDAHKDGPVSQHTTLKRMLVDIFEVKSAVELVLSPEGGQHRQDVVLEN